MDIDAVRDQIAAIVLPLRTVSRSGGGSCVYRAVTTRLALLTLFGIEAKLVWGSCLFRAGPDREHDVVRFSRHVWVEVGGTLIDFASGDWQREFSYSRRTTVVVSPTGGHTFKQEGPA